MEWRKGNGKRRSATNELTNENKEEIQTKEQTRENLKPTDDRIDSMSCISERKIETSAIRPKKNRVDRGERRKKKHYFFVPFFRCDHDSRESFNCAQYGAHFFVYFFFFVFLFLTSAILFEQLHDQSEFDTIHCHNELNVLKTMERNNTQKDPDELNEKFPNDEYDVKHFKVPIKTKMNEMIKCFAIKTQKKKCTF